MHDHHQAHAAHQDHEEAIPIDEWMATTKHLQDQETQAFRMLQRWDETAWLPFPDAGEYQPTRLTSANTAGNASAIWLKLEAGEGFDPHRHPNAIHMMTAFEGEADLFWQEDSIVYSTTMQVGKTPYVVLPTMPHAIVANRNQRIVMLVVNMPPDELSKHDYAQPVIADND